MITWQVIPVVLSWGCFPLTTYHDFLNRILPEAECMNLRKGRKFHILCYLSLSFPFPLLPFLSLPFPVAKRSPLNPTIVVCGALYELSQPGLAYLLIGLCPATSQAYLADDYRRVTNAGVRRLRSADNRTLHAHCFLPDSFIGVVITPLIKNKGDNLTDIYNYRAIVLFNTKILERLLLSKTRKSAFDGDKYQFGFKAGHSTTMCILGVVKKLLIIIVTRATMCLHVL